MHRLFHHGMVAGWGRKTQKGSPSRRLQKLFIEIFDEELCQRLFFDEHLICIGSYEEGGGNCFVGKLFCSWKCGLLMCNFRVILEDL